MATPAVVRPAKVRMPSSEDVHTDASSRPTSAAFRWRSGWTALVLTAVCRAVLALLASLLLWSVLPAALGWHTTVVMSGSMEPRLHPGDVVASRPMPGDKVRIGQVLLVNDPDHAGRLRLHRLVAIRPDGKLTLRGDANAADDSTPVARSAVKGVGSLRTPFVGMPAYLLQTHRTGALGLLGLGLGGLAAGALAFREDEDDAEDDVVDDDGNEGGNDGGTRGSTGDSAATEQPSRSDTSRRPLGHAAAMVLTALAVAVAGIGAATPADAATPFRGTTSNTADSWSAAPYFTCAAAVIADSPFFFYPLNDTNASTVTDASGNNRNGTFNGNVTRKVTGPCPRDGSAVTLSGTNGWVSTSTSTTGPNVFSLEIWFKTTSTAGGELIGFGNQSGASSTNDRHLFLTNSGKLVFGVYPGSTMKTIVSPKSYNDGTWHLADSTLSSGGMRLYVDGALVAGDSTTTTGEAYSGYWHIGYNTLTGWPNSPSSEYLGATIADAAVYTTALTSSQIAAHYAAG